MSGMHLSPEDRDELGRQVRQVWVEWALEQPNPKPSWLVGWDSLPEPDREVDRRIGERLTALPMAQVRAVGEVLLEVQRDCIAAVNEVDRLRAAVEAVRDAPGRHASDCALRDAVDAACSCWRGDLDRALNP